MSTGGYRHIAIRHDEYDTFRAIAHQHGCTSVAQMVRDAVREFTGKRSHAPVAYVDGRLNNRGRPPKAQAERDYSAAEIERQLSASDARRKRARFAAQRPA